MASDSTASISNAVAKTALNKDLLILRQLVTKDFKLKYRRSVLGVLWSVLNHERRVLVPL